MSVHYEQDGNLLLVTAVGAYASERFLETVRAALDDPATRTPTLLLCDVSRSRSLVDRSVDEVRASADFYGARLDQVRALAIVTSRLVDYGLMRMLASMAEVRGCRVEVFRDLEGARAWLSSLDASGEDPPDSGLTPS